MILFFIIQTLSITYHFILLEVPLMQCLNSWNGTAAIFIAQASIFRRQLPDQPEGTEPRSPCSLRRSAAPMGNSYQGGRGFSDPLMGHFKNGFEHDEVLDADKKLCLPMFWMFGSIVVWLSQIGPTYEKAFSFSNDLLCCFAQDLRP